MVDGLAGRDFGWLRARRFNMALPENDADGDQQRERDAQKCAVSDDFH
jgi:hypothetical protein